MVDLHGDVLGTIGLSDDTSTVTSLAYTASDEYGVPLDLSTGGVSANAPPRYGWLGGAQRSSDTLGGTVLMGSRVYAPSIGRFLSLDPTPGGNANVYDYCETITDGDRVWTRNLDTGTNELHTVTGLFHKEATAVMTVTVSDGTTVTVTEEHPFYVTDTGWVPSGNLQVGDRLAQRDHTSTTITALTRTPRAVTVYNFEVATTHNYYITTAQLLVHNCARPARLRPDPQASGPHSTFRRGPDGSVTHYATWAFNTWPRNPSKWKMTKRFDAVGDAHFNTLSKRSIPPPHIQGRKVPGGVRPASRWEIP